MKAEFAKKSSKKRQRIFVNRTQVLMRGLVDEITSKSEKPFTADDKKKLTQELSTRVLEAAQENIGHILSAEKEKPVSDDELTSYLVQRISQTDA